MPGDNWMYSNTGHRPPSEGVLELRRAIKMQMDIGVMALTTERISEIIREHEITPTDHINRSAVDLLVKKYKWKREKCPGVGSLYYHPNIPPRRLAQVRKSFERACKAIAKKRDARLQREAEYKRQARLSRLEKKKELMSGATSGRTPMEEYIFRAAKACGVVRGYRWEQ